MTVVHTLFWASLAFAGYTYLFYPALLKALARLRPPWPPVSPRPEWPMLSICLPAYNEEAEIGDTIESLLRLDYPADRRQILVVSDASTDRTDEIVTSYAARGVELLRVGERRGKTAAENAAREHLRGEIVVNTDASIRIAPDALKPLVTRFGDPAVGVASGRDVSVTRVEEEANAGESRYVGYEMWTRELESRVYGIVGASGCFYAIRRHLHHHVVPEELSRDFAAALTARKYGYRAVSVKEAVCFVPRTRSLEHEYRRKVRTMTRGMETLHYKRGLLNPLRYGLFAWMLFSHKVCRWLVPWAGLCAFASLAVLSVTEPWARLVFGAGLLAILGAVLGWHWVARGEAPRALALAAFVAGSNLAAMHAGIQALRAELNPVWEPTRRERAADG